MKKISIVMIFFIFVLELFFFSCESSSKKTEELKKEPQITKLTKIKGRIQIDEIKYSGPPKESWIVAGIRDTVTNDLAKVREVEAISIDDQNKALQMIAERRRAGEKNLDPSKESAKILAADYLCVGNLQNTGKVLRLNIRLLKAPDFSAEQTATIDGTLDEIFTLQDKVVESLLANVDAKMTPEERLVIEVFTPKSKKAYELHSRGLEIRNINPKKALEFSLQALELEPDYLDALNETGIIYDLLSNYESALTQFLKRKKIIEDKKLRNSNGYAVTLNNIAAVYDSQKNIEKAIEYYFDSLKLSEDLGSNKSQGYAATLNNIGLIFEGLEKYDEAYKYLSKSLNLYEEIDLKKTSSYASTLGSLALLLGSQKKYEDSLNYYSKSQTILEELGLGETSQYANLLNAIGVIYYSQGKEDDALKNYFKALKMREKLGLSLTEEYAITMKNIGAVYFNRREFCESLKWRGKAVKIQEQIKVPPSYKILEITRSQCNEQRR